MFFLFFQKWQIPTLKFIKHAFSHQSTVFSIYYSRPDIEYLRLITYDSIFNIKTLKFNFKDPLDL